MNFGLFGQPRLPGYKDFIFGRSAGTIWDIPFSAPPECSIPFEFEIYDAGSASSAGLQFLFNQAAPADHVFQTTTSNGAAVSSAAGNGGNFGATDVNGLAVGSGLITVGRSRISWTSLHYRGVPGTSIFWSSYAGVLNANPGPSLAVTPFSTGIKRLQLIHGGSAGFSKNSRFRLFEPQPVFKNC